MSESSPVLAEQSISILENSSLYKYWDKDTQESVKDVIRNTPEKDLPKLMEDLMAQDSKMKLAEEQDAKENKVQMEREMRVQAKAKEKNEEEEARAYAEKLIDSLGHEKIVTAVKKKQHLLPVLLIVLVLVIAGAAIYYMQK
jgi:hypothetical protein